MGVAALVLGIISIIIGFVPFCGVIAFFPALIGLILGIIDLVQKSKKSEPKGMAIAGVILTGIAIIIIALWIFVFGAIVAGTTDYIDTHEDEITTFFNSEIEDWEDFDNEWLDSYYYENQINENL